MSALRASSILLGMLALSACNGQSAQQISTNSAVRSDDATLDADTRAEHLAEQSSLLNAEASETGGAHRQALQNEARSDMSQAVTIESQGETDAENIARVTEKEVRGL